MLIVHKNTQYSNIVPFLIIDLPSVGEKNFQSQVEYIL